MSVTLSDVKRAARAHRAPLAGESAGYLILAVADQVSSAPRKVRANDIQLTEEGGLRVLSGRASSDEDAECSLRQTLDDLLLVASPASAALVRASRRAAPLGLAGLVHELEAALIPVNRAAARRTLSRIHRDTLRALSSGTLPAEEGDEPLVEPGLGPVAVGALVPAEFAPATVVMARIVPVAEPAEPVVPARVAPGAEPAEAVVAPPRAPLGAPLDAVAEDTIIEAMAVEELTVAAPRTRMTLTGPLDIADPDASPSPPSDREEMNIELDISDVSDAQVHGDDVVEQTLATVPEVEPARAPEAEMDFDVDVDMDMDMDVGVGAELEAAASDSLSELLHQLKTIDERARVTAQTRPPSSSHPTFEFSPSFEVTSESGFESKVTGSPATASELNDAREPEATSEFESQTAPTVVPDASVAELPELAEVPEAPGLAGLAQEDDEQALSERPVEELTRPEPVILRKSTRPDAVSVAPTVSEALPPPSPYQHTPTLGSCAAELPLIALADLAEVEAAQAARSNAATPAEASVLVESTKAASVNVAGLALEAALAGHTEPAPEVEELAVGAAIVPPRKSDVRELLSNFQVATDDTQQGLCRAIKEMAELDLTPAPFAALVR